MLLRVLSPALGSVIAALVRPTALAWRSRLDSLPACSDSSPVSERPCTTVSVGALHHGLQCWQAAASAFRQPSPTCRTTFLAQHLRPSGLLSCWVYSSSQGCHTATGTHMLHGIIQCYLPPDRGDIPALTPAEAGTRLSNPRGMQGWVDLVGLLHTEMVYPPEDGHPSRY